MTARHRKRHKKEWSPTRAARAAWEARIATVRHLEEALIARVWPVGKLQRAYQFQLASVGRHGAATALLYGGMGYRPRWPADWQAATEMIVADEARYLATADLYVLAPHMCDVVIAAAQTLSGRAACGASRAHLPLPRREVLPLAVQGVEVMSRDPRMRGEPWAVGGKIHRQAAGGQPGSLGEIIVYPVDDRHAGTGPGHVQPEPRPHHELSPACLAPRSPFHSASSLPPC